MVTMMPLTHDDREQLIARLQQGHYAVDDVVKQEDEAQARFILFWADLFTYFGIDDSLARTVTRLQFYERDFIEILLTHGTWSTGIYHPNRIVYIKAFKAFARPRRMIPDILE
jgi:hypothetical protein